MGQIFPASPQFFARRIFGECAIVCGLSLRSCTVSVKDARGIRHSVDVTAETLYEAAALGLSMLRQDEWADVIGPGTELEVRVREPETVYSVTVMQIRRWTDGVAVSPDEVIKRNRVKAMLGTG